MSDRHIEEITQRYEEILGRHEALLRRVDFMERRLDAVANDAHNFFGYGSRTAAVSAMSKAVKKAMALIGEEERDEARMGMLGYDYPEDYYAALALVLKDSCASAIPAIDAARDACVRFAMTWDEIGVTKDKEAK